MFTGGKWKFQTNGRVSSSPAVENGLVYVGSMDQNLYAVDQQTGALTWKFATEDPVVSSPALAGGIVYFASYDGKFYALDAATGQLKWKFETAGERRDAGRHLHGLLRAAETMPDPWDYFLSSPAVWNGAVYCGSGDGNVYALDAVSGSLKWKLKTGDDAEIHNHVGIQSSPAVTDGTVYFGCRGSNVYAVDAKSCPQSRIPMGP